MATPISLRGIVTVLNTPFTDEDTIDLSALAAHVELAKRAGVCGILVPAMASEVHKLSLSERIRMVETVMETAGPDLPTIAGTAARDGGDSVALLRAYLDIGCTHVLFQIPFEDEATFRRRFFELAGLQPEVIMLQDWDVGGSGLPDHLIVELFDEVDAFRCLKVETVPAGPKYSRMLEWTGGELHVSGGWAVTQMMEGLRRGVHAFMPTGMHYAYTEIYRAFVDGNRERAQHLFEQILPVIAFSNQHIDISIHFFKRLLKRQGIYPTARIRAPSLSFDSIHEEIAEELIDRVIRMETDIERARQPDMQQSGSRSREE